MKKLLLICFILVVALLTSCDYQKRECVARATKCLTDDAYRDSLYRGWRPPVNKDSLVDSLFAMLREQRQFLLDMKAERNVGFSDSAKKPNVEMLPVVEKPNVAPIIENIEEPVGEENANSVSNVSAENAGSQPEERKWGKLVTGAGAAIVGAAVGAAVVDKLHCNERLDITVEYKLMVACLNSCGYDEETLEKCGAGIMQWLCKEKEKAETIMNRVRTSCSVR